MVRVLTARIGRHLKDSCSIHEGRSFVYWLNEKDDGQAEDTWQLSLHGNSQQKEMCLLNDTMMETMRLLGGTVLQVLRWTQVGRMYGFGSRLSYPTAVTYFR